MKNKNMKKSLLLFSIVFIASSCATTIPVTSENNQVNNFLFDNGTVTWSNVYEFKKEDYDAVRKWFSTDFQITKEDEKYIIGETNRNSLPVQEAGLDRMAVVMLLSHPCVVYFNADFKEDRYRVIVNRIIWYPQVGITTHGVTHGVGAMDLNELAVRGGGYSSSFYKTSSAQLNTILKYLFTPKLNSGRSDDNW